MTDIPNTQPDSRETTILDAPDKMVGIRDLFGIQVDAKTLLPQDSTSEGFDNVADALSVSPAFIVLSN